MLRLDIEPQHRFQLKSAGVIPAHHIEIDLASKITKNKTTTRRNVTILHNNNNNQ